MIVIKRDGREVDFDKSKIFNAVYKAVVEVDKIIPQKDKETLASDIANKLQKKYNKLNRAITVEGQGAEKSFCVVVEFSCNIQFLPDADCIFCIHDFLSGDVRYTPADDVIPDTVSYNFQYRHELYSVVENPFVMHKSVRIKFSKKL